MFGCVPSLVWAECGELVIVWPERVAPCQCAGQCREVPLLTGGLGQAAVLGTI